MSSATPLLMTFAAGEDGAVLISCDPTLTSLTIPAEHAGMAVVRIADNALRDHPRLLSVTLPPSLRIIGENAFMNCQTLMQVHGGEGVQRIGPYAFFRCVSLRHVEFPAQPLASPTSFAACYQLEAAGESVRYR